MSCSQGQRNKMEKKYQVLSPTKKSFNPVVIERENLTKSKAERLSKKLKGTYCGKSKGSLHKKIKNGSKHEGDCYKLNTKIREQ